MSPPRTPENIRKTCVDSIKQTLLGIFIGLALATLLLPLIAKALETPDPAIYQSPASETALVASGGIVIPADIAQKAIATTSVKEMVVSAFPDAPVMLRVAKAESHLIPTAKNPYSTATGVFQILKGTWAAYGCTGSRTNAADNIACARKIYDAEGTDPWVSSSANW